MRGAKRSFLRYQRAVRQSTGTYSPSLSASREEVIQSRHTAEAKNKLDLAIVYSNIVIKWENLEINSSHLLNTANFSGCRSKLRRFYLDKLLQYICIISLLATLRIMFHRVTI